MDEVIKMLNDIPNSSVYGNDMDELYLKLKDADTVHKLLTVDIDNYTDLINSLRDKMNSVSKFKTNDLIRVFRGVPSIAQWGEFI